MDRQSVERAEGLAIPIPLTSLVGRDREVGAVLALLARPDVRLLTLTGPGGAGKTRLSLAVSARLLDQFKDGVFFVDLAALRDPALVLPTIAAAVGIHETRDEPLIESIHRRLGRRSALLVLDNFEQLLTAAPTVASLLQRCPSLTALVTSRSALRLSGEHELPVPPLACPDPQLALDLDALLQYEAVALFVQRARAIRPDFQLSPANATAIAELCRRLDGLPLAIELAAARVKLLSPQALLARLANRLALLTGGARDRPARHQTLRDTIDWSYDLLTPVERRLFARLAVFVGGFDVSAGCWVSGVGSGDDQTPPSTAQDPTSEALDVLQSLMDQSLLRQADAPDGEPRFAMLETIREYALERLDASDAAEQVRRRHAEHYLELLEAAVSGYRGPEQPVWLERVASEHDNARAALIWAIDRRDSVLALRMAGALGPFWLTRGHLSEGQRWLDLALALAPDDQSALRARALNAAGHLAFYRGDAATAAALHEETLRLWEGLQDPAGMAAALHNLARDVHYQGQYDRAADLYQESLPLWRAVQDKRGLAVSLNSLGVLLRDRGDNAAARALYEESLALNREVEDLWGQAVLLNNLARIDRDTGDAPRARQLCAESLDLFVGLGDRQGLTWVLSNLAIMAQREGASVRAARLIGATRTVLDALGSDALSASPGEVARYDASISQVREHLGPTVFASLQAATRAMSLEQIIELGRTAVAGATDEGVTAGASQSDDKPPLVGPYADPLTRREGEVAALVARGLTDRQIAAELVIAEGTVGVHLERIFGKLGVHSRAQLAVWVVERRLATADPE